MLLHAVVGLRDRGRRERVGRDDVGAGAQVGEMDVADRVGLGEIEQVVVAAHLAVPGVEARAAELLLLQLQRLDHRPHGAVEHQDALARQRAQLVRRGGLELLDQASHPPALRAGTRSPAGDRKLAQSEQMADRVDQVGAVHRVEVEVAHAAIDQVEHLLGGDRGGDQLARRHVVVEPGEAVGEPGRDRGAAALREACASA